MKAILLAAGKSSRITSKINNIPKPLIEINGKPILQYNIEMLKRYGIDDLIINTHYKKESIKERFGNGNKFGVNIQYIDEEILLGTAGTIKSLEDMLKGPFLVVYADNLTKINIKELIDYHYKKKRLITIAIYDYFKTPNSKIASGKIIIDEDMDIVKFIETSDLPTEFMKYVNAGIYVAEPELINYIPNKIPCDFSKDVFPKLLEQKIKMQTYILSGFCYGMDTLRSLNITKRSMEVKYDNI